MNILEQLQSITETARQSNHRQLLVLAGEETWGQQQAEQIGCHLEADESLWLGDRQSEGSSVRARKAFSWLGRELDFIVFNSYSGFDVDAFGAISGSLKAGGLLVLLTPELNSWPDFADPEHQRLMVYPFEKIPVASRYLQRLSALVASSKQLPVVKQCGTVCWQPDVTAGRPITVTAAEPCRTPEQQQAVEALIRVAKGHRRRPLVLTADRGRGKSAALGIAAAQLLEKGLNTVLVTAPSMASAEVMFQHAESLLPDAKVTAGLIEWQGKTIRFLAPDELVQSIEETDCDLILVDEAAAIPVSILTRLLQRFARIAFASTVHGYEGTGRGFAVKFRKILDKQTPQWRALHIHQPVRWADNDPLEAFVFESLLLDAEPAAWPAEQLLQLESLELEKHDRDSLAASESTLKQIFGLLVLAHYKTRPFDLRHLLDGPNIDVFSLKQKGVIVATALLAKEGAIGDELAEAIWLGKRRVKGHLIPQSLSNHSGYQQAIRFKGYRVIRIAVHPDLQGQGVGQHFLEQLTRYAQQQKLDYMGSSFGASEELVSFWGKSGFHPVRTGLVREASSGCYSLMVIKALSSEFSDLTLEVRREFGDSLLLQLADNLQELEAGLVREILNGCVFPIVTLSRKEQLDLDSFIHSDRLYESCQLAIKKLLLLSLSNQVQVECSVQHRLIARVLQNQSWQSLARSSGLTGRKQVVARLKDDVRQLSAALG